MYGGGYGGGYGVNSGLYWEFEINNVGVVKFYDVFV